jgi:outer membrane protein assembly factor BamD (BamD/ComL family)
MARRRPEPRIPKFERGRWGRCLLAPLLWSLLAACANPTVVEKSAIPRTKEVPGRGEYRWEVHSGWILPSLGGWGPPAQVRAEARKAFEAGSYADALNGFLAYKVAAPVDDPSLGQANFMIAECYYHLGRYEDAIDFYREVYQRSKPEGEILNRTFKRVYDIAMDYLKGTAACSFLGFYYNCPGDGIELLRGDNGLITEYPHLSFADDAVYKIATHYFNLKEYPEAGPLYEEIINDYPQSDRHEEAEYYLALSIFKQVRGTDYDEKMIQDADRKFRLYLEHYPRGPRAADVRGKLREITQILGAKNLKIAKFYLRESEPRAAKIYLRIVLDDYPTSAAAREAREIQRKL